MNNKTTNHRSISNSRTRTNKNMIFTSPKLSRKYYEEKAQVITMKERIAFESLYEFDQNSHPSTQVYSKSPDIAGIYFNTPYKIDKALVNFNNYRNYQNMQMGSSHLAVGPNMGLDQLLQIKPVVLVNQYQTRRSPPMNQTQSKFCVSGPNSLTNSHLHQKYEGEVLQYPSYGRNDTSFDTDKQNGTLPNFKLSYSAFYKQPDAADKGRIESALEHEILTDRSIEPASLGNSRPTSQNFNRQGRLGNQRYHETEQDLYRRTATQQLQRRPGQQPVFMPKNGLFIGNGGQILEDPRKMQQGQSYPRTYLLSNKANIMNGVPMHKATTIFHNHVGQSYGQQTLYPVVLSNGSIVNMLLSNYNGQVANQSSRSYSNNPNRTNLTPPPSQAGGSDSNNNTRMENSMGPLPIQKNLYANEAADNFNKYGGYSLTSSIGSLTSATTNPTHTNGVTESMPINSLNLPGSNIILTKLTRPEYMGPEEKERRRMNYQAATRRNFTYKYFLGEGNNAELVKRVLDKRGYWGQTESYNSLFNLKWQQTDYGYRYERMVGNPNLKQLLNHFEYHAEITTKNGLIKSLSSYCEANKIAVFDFTPITFQFDMDDPSFDSDMHHFTTFFIKNCGDPKKYASNDQCTVKKGNPSVLFTYEFKSKGKILHILQKSVYEKKVSPFLKPKLTKTYYNGANMWLLKPTGLNRGRGIELFNTLEELNKYINQYLEGDKSPIPKTGKKEDGNGEQSESDEESKAKKGPPETKVRSNTFVIQKYIEHPLLVNQRKFDIRVYAMVTHEMQLFFFKEGYLRTSSEVYSIGEKDIDNKFVHLTNDAVQKYSDKYGQSEQGNKLSYDEFQKYLDANGIPLDVTGKVIPKMKELVQISMNSVKKVLNQNDRKYCFEVFGYDFFIDAELNVWLIEVNTNPCLEESCPLLGAIIPRMLDDAFKLTVDVLFPSPYKKQQSKQINSKPVARKETRDTAITSETDEKATIDKSKLFPLFNYDDNENLWEHLCSVEFIRSSPKKLANSDKRRV